MKNRLLTLISTTSLLFMIGNTTLSAAPQGMSNQNKRTPVKPFLIIDKLPHLSMMIKVLWDDEDLALTPEQKTKLIQIRQETRSAAMAIAGEIDRLEAEIVKASFDGVKPEDLQTKVNELASLRAQATMAHLACIYNTRVLLTQEQLDIIE